MVGQETSYGTLLMELHRLHRPTFTARGRGNATEVFLEYLENEEQNNGKLIKLEQSQLDELREENHVSVYSSVVSTLLTRPCYDVL